jgi:hypothetical protein
VLRQLGVCIALYLLQILGNFLKLASGVIQAIGTLADCGLKEMVDMFMHQRLLGTADGLLYSQ